MAEFLKWVFKFNIANNSVSWTKRQCIMPADSVSLDLSDIILTIKICNIISKQAKRSLCKICEKL